MLPIFHYKKTRLAEFQIKLCLQFLELDVHMKKLRWFKRKATILFCCIIGTQLKEFKCKCYDDYRQMWGIFSLNSNLYLHD